MNQTNKPSSLPSAGSIPVMGLPLTQVVNKEMVYEELFWHMGLNYKLQKQLSAWINNNFRYYVLRCESNPNKAMLVVQNIPIKEYPTVCFYSEKGNLDAVLNDLAAQLFEYCKNPPGVDLTKRNILVNRWWKNYIGNLKIV